MPDSLQGKVVTLETEQEEEMLKEDAETAQAAGKKKKATRKAKTV